MKKLLCKLFGHNFFYGHLGMYKYCTSCGKPVKDMSTSEYHRAATKLI